MKMQPLSHTRPASLWHFDAHSVALLTAWALVSTGSWAQTATATPAASEAALVAAFARADRNGDGQLSRDEAQRLPAVAEQFSALDRNGDNQLSRDEFMLGLKT